MDSPQSVSSQRSDRIYIADNGNVYYRLRRLGSGGTADVYLCRDANDNQNLVMKIPRIRSKFRTGVKKLFLKQFKFEQDWMNAHKNPNILQIIDKGKSEGVVANSKNHFYVTKKYSSDLLTLLQSTRGLSGSQKAKIVSQIASGLRFLEEQKIIHRDLKPENILIQERGGLFNAVISDLGMAWMEEKSSEFDIKKWEEERPIRNKDYWAPEQNFPGVKATHFMDQWAFAYIIYEIYMGSGQLPRTDSPPAIHEVEAVDELFDEIRLKMNSHDPNDRFSSLSTVQNVLDFYFSQIHPNYQELSNEERKFRRKQLQLTPDISKLDLENFCKEIDEFNQSYVYPIDFVGFPVYLTLKSAHVNEIYIPLVFNLESVTEANVQIISEEIEELISPKVISNDLSQKYAVIQKLDTSLPKINQLLVFGSYIEDESLFPRLFDVINSSSNPIVIGDRSIHFTS